MYGWKAFATHWNKRRDADYRFAEAEDGAISGKMRALAVELRVDGRKKLTMESNELRLLKNRAAVPEAYEERIAAWDCCLRNVRMMEACAEQICRENAPQLPACGRVPRILRIVQRIVGRGEIRLTKERLMLALASFDEVQPLEMDELWAVPLAVRICSVRGFGLAASEAAGIVQNRSDAENWLDSGCGPLKNKAAAFYEHALRLAVEREDVEQHARLEESLAAAGLDPEKLVREAHAEEAVVRMRLENYVCAKRLMDSLDWCECFEELSSVEAELRYDPAGVYAAMEESSRAEIRGRISEISRKLKIKELTVARHAVKAAQSASDHGEPDEKTTVCYWLYDDAGRAQLAQRMGYPKNALPRMIPDPSGKRCAWGIVVVTAVLYGLLMRIVGSIWLALPGIPVAWCAATAVVGRFYHCFVGPKALLKMRMDSVPDEMRTLVTMPVLLSSLKRAGEICDQFEALGCLEKDENIRYLLLGDFADADVEHEENDARIVDFVRGRVRQMNARVGTQRYYYLHRNRRLLEADGRWMGRDRKRGALMDLNRLLLGRNGAEDAFGAENAGSEALKRRFRYVVTLDADTRFVPGTIQRLIGALAHPLNRARKDGTERKGFAILQPRMEMAADACVNRYVRLFAGKGGLNTYASSVSDFWQDFTGNGIFCGKGIYDVRAFMDALEGALPEGRILSHDLIEGILARGALVSDICFYDGYPTSLSAFMRRMNRWIRGDWQLLPQLLSLKRYPVDNRRLAAADRSKLLDNLMRSLYAPALMGFLTTGLWMGNGSALMAGLATAFLTPLLALTHMKKEMWKRVVAELAVLPITAAYSVDAIVRTLWRLLFTGRHLLEWVTAADAEGIPGGLTLPGRVSAILALPGLFTGQAAAAIALGLLFAVGPEWIKDYEQTPIGEDARLESGDVAFLLSVAADTWRFFERYVAEDGNFLPPDNVQIDPDVGAARRTSPTNIGMYMMSCVAACRLRLISEEERNRRLNDTLRTVECLERWKGHLYNWYDIDTIEPLKPRYVSSVDSGNLAASLLLCASAVKDAPALAERLARTARTMDFSVLYDEERELFLIGMDVEHDQLSNAHYDLLASEARILSFTAMMLGQIPVRHWMHLGRPVTNVSGHSALVSWSGTMFEYLMPELFMHTCSNTLLGGSVRSVVRAQKEFGTKKKRPWGVSESGYHAFDLQLNYQYRAFGLQQLSMGGNCAQDVVAPYAAMLALCVETGSAVENLYQMQSLGWRGEYGFYEAADYQHTEEGGEPRLVKSYMAHHQGMALCALCNALSDHSIAREFMSIPEASALELLLQEPQAEATSIHAELPEEKAWNGPGRRMHDRRNAQPARRVVDCHMLGGAGAAVLVTADGAMHYQRDGIQATRFGGDLLNRNDGACVHLKLERTGEEAVFGSERAVYEPGKAIFECTLGPLACRMWACVSPEDGALIKSVEIRNTSACAESVRVADCLPVALGKTEDMLAHPVFRHLFVESERLSACALAFRRRPRSERDVSPILLHLVSTPGSVSCETDLEKLVGRMGSTMQPGGIDWAMQNTTGTVLNPCSALQSTVSVLPGQKVKLHFAVGLTTEDEKGRWLERNFEESTPERAAGLASMQTLAMLGFLGIDSVQYFLLQRMAALLFDRRLSVSNEIAREKKNVRREDLWSLGISGNLPILLIDVHAQEEIGCVRAAVRAHEFYRTQGLRVDLVLINEHGNDYNQPVRDALSDAVAFSHLNDLRGVPGGVHMLDGEGLTEEQRLTLLRTSICLNARCEFYSQLRDKLSELNRPMYTVKQMHPGENRLPELRTENGYGRFLSDGSYTIDVLPERTTPAPWSNILANERFGVLLTERGGGFLWANNSRSGRLTAFCNDILDEGWGWMLYLVNEDNGEFMRLLPGRAPMAAFRVTFSPYEAIYRFKAQRLAGEVTVCVDPQNSELRIHSVVRSGEAGRYRLVGFVDWLMGTDAMDACCVNTWSRDGACFATGAAKGVGFFAAAHPRVYAGEGRAAFLGRGTIQSPEGIGSGGGKTAGWCLNIPVELRADVPMQTDWLIGWAAEPQRAYARVRTFYANPSYEAVRACAEGEWRSRMEKLQIETPDDGVNAMANGWLTHQSLTGRIRARTGLYQPGGAFGFRDQLQDMLAMLPFEPGRVREHILRCAAHQFEDGDVMHWWHEPYLGVRTKISDDMLFLPYVTARYIRWTEDASILEEQIPYLKNVVIPEGEEDRFGEMQPGDVHETLHEHCMRAFRRANATGVHGLTLMGSGDWNDGMNRMGVQGRGESVWLSEFLAVCAQDYAQCIPFETDRLWLVALSDHMRAAVESAGWDGGWYLRAYTDAGEVVGSAGGTVCRIDAISQAWAVLAELDDSRCSRALEAAWQLLADEETGIIRLLTPPFDGDGMDPGYIKGYPAGVRENGAQYTHAACWILLALIRRGDARRVHKALQMLLPMNHASTNEDARRYRVEPYVLAADIYDGNHAGRGGWTWYTGSASWLYLCILEILGFEQRGNKVRLNALLGEWPEVSVTLKWGSSWYRLISGKGVEKVRIDGVETEDGWAVLSDDGRDHEIQFPERAAICAVEEREPVLQG